MMWLLMALEQPIIAATIARLPDPEANLAAFGLAFSVALIIESPVIMLLMAGTALADDLRSYRLLLRFAATMAIVVTIVHLATALTPAYALIMGRLVGAPEVSIEPGRRALVMMWGWSGAIAFRRLWQGVMIKHDRTTRVGLTTVARVVVLVAVCAAGLRLLSLPGAELGGLALNCAVIAAAIVAYVLVRPTLASMSDDGGGTPLDYGTLLSFYVPLALTSFILLGSSPLISVGLSRSPEPVVALALWPVLLGLLFVFRSPGYAFQEVAVALLGRPGAPPALVRFTRIAAVALSAGLAVIALTPLADLWLGGVSGLAQPLVDASRGPLLLLTPVPGLTMLAAWARARLVQQGRTSVITQAVAVNLVVLALVMALGLDVLAASASGASIAAVALVVSLGAENGWLSWRLRAA